jgi:hypothetical protein
MARNGDKLTITPTNAKSTSYIVIEGCLKQGWVINI